MQKFQYVRRQNTETLSNFLSRRFPYQDQKSWRKHILSGALQVNEKTVSPDLILNTKDIISYSRPKSAEPEVDRSFNVLYEDDVILVVEKNGNLPVSESGKYYKNTLINVLKEAKKYKELFAVHRLDRETSGIVLMSKTKEAATILGKEFLNNRPKKQYHAVLNGKMEASEMIVEQPIFKVKRDRLVRIRQIIDERGKPSKTKFVLLHFKNGLSLVKINTYTGRTHQIRCHAEFLKLAILGDKLYGQTDEKFLAMMKKEEKNIFPPYGEIKRQILHASGLEIRHPKTDKILTIYSDHEPFFKKFTSVAACLLP